MTDEQIERRVLALAHMAAMLDAGDRAGQTDDGPSRQLSPAEYVNRAAQLFTAADDHIAKYGTNSKYGTDSAPK